jgi:hypothetical protein
LYHFDISGTEFRMLASPFPSPSAWQVSLQLCYKLQVTRGLSWPHCLTRMTFLYIMAVRLHAGISCLRKTQRDLTGCLTKEMSLCL